MKRSGNSFAVSAQKCVSKQAAQLRISTQLHSCTAAQQIITYALPTAQSKIYAALLWAVKLTKSNRLSGCGNEK